MVSLLVLMGLCGLGTAALFATQRATVPGDDRVGMAWFGVIVSTLLALRALGVRLKDHLDRS